jgi:hypothetical protein
MLFGEKNSFQLLHPLTEKFLHWIFCFLHLGLHSLCGCIFSRVHYINFVFFLFDWFFCLALALLFSSLTGALWLSWLSKLTCRNCQPNDFLLASSDDAYIDYLCLSTNIGSCDSSVSWPVSSTLPIGLHCAQMTLDGAIKKFLVQIQVGQIHSFIHSFIHPSFIQSKRMFDLWVCVPKNANFMCSHSYFWTDWNEKKRKEKRMMLLGRIENNKWIHFVIDDWWIIYIVGFQWITENMCCCLYTRSKVSIWRIVGACNRRNSFLIYLFGIESARKGSSENFFSFET